MKKTPLTAIDIFRGGGGAILCLIFSFFAFGCSSPEPGDSLQTKQPVTGPFTVRVDNSVSKIPTGTTESPFIVISKVGDLTIPEGAAAQKADAGAVITLTVSVPENMAATNFKVNGAISPLKISGEGEKPVIYTYTFTMPAAAAVIRGTLTPSKNAEEFLANLDEAGVTDAFDTTLQALNIAQGMLIPVGVEPQNGFESAITEYTANIPYSAYPAVITATPNNSEAKVNVAINPEKLEGAGEFTVTIEVSSLFWELYPDYADELPDGASPKETKTYTVTVTRAAGDNTTTLSTVNVPQAGILEQSGNVYAGTVSYNIAKLDIIATAAHPNARVVKILDGGVEKSVEAANSVSFQVDAPGTAQSKTITVRVSAEDGTPGDNTINIFKDDSEVTYYATGGIVNLIKKEGTEDEYYEIHTFMFNPAAQSGGQTDYTLTFTQKPANDKVEVLVVAGGGGGGKGATHRAGGGGAGRFIYDSAYDISGNDSFAVKVGAGGAITSGKGGNGADSEFGGEFVAKGGGGGGYHWAYNRSNGNPGGSGGGSTAGVTAPGAALTGTAPEGALNLGNAGGAGVYDGSGGGGGGAGTGGDVPSTTAKGANGGSGTQSAISGALSWYAGGGAGGAEDQYNQGPQYGAGQGNSGEAGTGDGGSGGGGVDGKLNGGNGGSGIVIVRWPWVAPETPE